MFNDVRIVEVGPRNSLQAQTVEIDTIDHVHLIDLLSDCGFQKIEATCFADPQHFSKNAACFDVLKRIKRNSDVRYGAVLLGIEEYQSAKAANIDEIGIFASSSEAYSQYKLDCSVAESLKKLEPVITSAQRDGIRVRGYVSCVIRCPYEGNVAPEKVAYVSKKLLDMGCYEISLVDELGAGRPKNIHALLDTVIRYVGPEHLAAQYYNTDGFALHNIAASLGKGVKVFDSSVGGIGVSSCKASTDGHVATRDVINLLEKFGFKTNVNLHKLELAEQFVAKLCSQNSSNFSDIELQRATY